MANQFKTFVAGDVLTAAQVNTFLMKQAVIVCDSSGDYPTSPVEGMTVYDKGADALKVYTTATTGWQPPWSLPWGRVAYASTTTAQTTSSATEQDLSGLSVTFTAVANRIYRLSGFVIGRWTATGEGYIPLYAGSTFVVASVQYATANQAETLTPTAYVTNLSGSTTVKLRATGPSAFTTAAAASYPLFVCVEDMGPNGAPA
jgi:hypothetical protein